MRAASWDAGVDLLHMECMVRVPILAQAHVLRLTRTRYCRCNSPPLQEPSVLRACAGRSPMGELQQPALAPANCNGKARLDAVVSKLVGRADGHVSAVPPPRRVSRGQQLMKKGGELARAGDPLAAISQYNRALGIEPGLYSVCLELLPVRLRAAADALSALHPGLRLQGSRLRCCGPIQARPRRFQCGCRAPPWVRRTLPAQRKASQTRYKLTILTECSAEVFFNRAVAHARCGGDDEALADLDAALAMDPSLVVALKNRALINRRQVRQCGVSATLEVLTFRAQGKFFAAKRDYLRLRHLRSVGETVRKQPTQHSDDSAPSVVRKRPQPGQLVAFHEMTASSRRVRVKSTTSFDQKRSTAAFKRPQTDTAVAEVIGPKPPSDPADDVFSFIFSSPSAVQLSLRRAPSRRSIADVDRIFQLMAGLHFFRTFSAQQKRAVCKVSCWRGCCLQRWLTLRQAIRYTALPSNFSVCQQGQESKEFYVVLSGSLSVRLKIEAVNAELTLGILSAGQSFGQLGLVYNAPVCTRLRLHALVLQP